MRICGAKAITLQCTTLDESYSQERPCLCARSFGYITFQYVSDRQMLHISWKGCLTCPKWVYKGLCPSGGWWLYVHSTYLHTHEQPN